MSLPEKYVESFQSLLQQIKVNDEQRYQEIVRQLTIAINYLINHDFRRLVQLLYTIDVSEKKLKQALTDTGSTDAAQIIAEMVIQRQMEKLISKQKYTNRATNISDEEKW
jgi:hypothetical protein